MKKKILSLLLVLVLLPTLHVFANADMSGTSNYLYLTPNEDGSINILNKISGPGTSGTEFAVPEGASEVDVTRGGKLENEKIIATEEIEGNINIEYQYKVQPSESGEFNYAIPLAGAEFIVLVPEGKGAVTSTNSELLTAPPMDISGSSYVMTGLISSEANQPITLQYDPAATPVPTATDSGGETEASASSTETTATPSDFEKMWQDSPFGFINPYLFFAIIAVVLVLIILAGVYFSKQEQKSIKQISHDDDEKAFKLLVTNRQTLLDKTLEIEDQRLSGEISQEEYEVKRDVYRDLLIKVSLQLREYTE